MIRHRDIQDIALREKIRHGTVLYGGNRKLNIYGTLDCYSGKRMKRENRVFFESSDEAKSEGYRPCGHCMKSEYQKWIYSANR
ncbi:MAG TPA: metal-binding protein [Gammaproteobacteria bacterium]|nr:metal-binding protein [Gammaproteobacteria bacterium]